MGHGKQWSLRILWYVITYPCCRCLLLHSSPHVITATSYLTPWEVNKMADICADNTSVEFHDRKWWFKPHWWFFWRIQLTINIIRLDPWEIRVDSWETNINFWKSWAIHREEVRCRIGSFCPWLSWMLKYIEWSSVAFILVVSCVCVLHSTRECSPHLLSSLNKFPFAWKFAIGMTLMMDF